jgi:hypothetical protein
VLAAMARALAQHGSADDIGLLLQQMAYAPSPLARQQVALSIAHLMGRYDTLYALLTADELRRDQLIEKTLAARLRESPALSDALRAYAHGDYSCALQTLCHAMPHHTPLQQLAHAPNCIESWLLAVSVV